MQSPLRQWSVTCAAKLAGTAIQPLKDWPRRTVTVEARTHDIARRLGRRAILQQPDVIGLAMTTERCAIIDTEKA